MQRSMLTSKGQVVIPKALRDELELHKGDELIFRRMGEALLVLPSKSLSVDEALAKISGSTKAFAGFEAERTAAARAISERWASE